MRDTDIVLWQGGITSLQLNQAATPLIFQPRFFLPSNIVVGRYGVVGMLVVDSKPRQRHTSYHDTEWTGVDIEESDIWDLESYDLVRRAHFLNTDQGFSIIRAFALPSHVADLFARDRFLGDPFIEKCACDGTFDAPFDEERAATNLNPVDEALSLIEAVAFAGWQTAGITDPKMSDWRQIRTWLSFHGWFAFTPAIEQGQLSLQRAIGNFDTLLQRVATQIQPYAPDTTKISGAKRDELPKNT